MCDELPPHFFPHCRARVRCSHPLAFRYLKQRFLKFPPFIRPFKFAHHPGFDIAPVTDPTLRKRSAGLIESLAVPCVDCCEPKKFQARLLYPIYCQIPWLPSLPASLTNTANCRRMYFLSSASN